MAGKTAQFPSTYPLKTLSIIISLNEALGSHASGTKMEYNFSKEFIRGRKILKDNLI